MSGFKEFKRDEGVVRKALASASKQAYNEGEQDLPLHKPVKGQTILRVLPAFDERGLWFRELKQHDIYYEDVIFRGTCPGWSECAICQARQQLAAQNDEATIELSGKMRAKKLFIFNVIVYQEPGGANPSQGTKILTVGVKAAQQILKADMDANLGLGDITNVATGHDIYIDRTGEGRQTEYSVRAHAQKTDLRATLAQANYNLDDFQQYNLSEILLPATPEQLEGVVECLGLGTRTVTAPAPIDTTGSVTVPAPVAPEPVPVLPQPAPSQTNDPNPNVVPQTTTVNPNLVLSPTPLPGPIPPFKKENE